MVVFKVAIYYFCDMMRTLTIHDESELNLLVDAFLDIARDTKVAFLYGDLGAGKTTFVKSLVKRLGATEEASSPTYSLVNEYEIEGGKLYHVDLYRLNDEEEALDIGIEEYIYSGHYCLIEWPQVVERLVEEVVTIKIVTNEDESRSVELDLTKL